MPFALRKGGWVALGVQALLLPLFALSGQVGAASAGCVPGAGGSAPVRLLISALLLYS